MTLGIICKFRIGKFRTLVHIFSVIVACPPLTALAADVPYKKHAILEARFGDETRRDYLQKAYRIKDTINKSVIGQDRVAEAVQVRLVQYLENFGTRTKDPISFHLVGLPGVGKSAIIDILGKAGIPMFRVDAQAFANTDDRYAINYFLGRLEDALEEQTKTKQPLILLIDELDKIPEITETNGGRVEKTSTLIGLLNQALTDGRMSSEIYNRVTLNLSNTLIVTSMNLSPQEIETFSSDVLGRKKNFYDFTIADFAQFDAWLRKDPSARPKVLSHLFRSNTVSRMASNTLIVRPLDENDYKGIIRLNIKEAILSSTQGTKTERKVEVGNTEDFVNFLYKYVVYPPSGARDTVLKTNALTEQLISFGTRAYGKEKTSVLRPRAITLDYDPAQDRAVVHVVSKIRRGRQTFDDERWSFTVAFDEDSRAFRQPDRLMTEAVSLSAKASLPPEKKVKPVTKKEIRAARFPKRQNSLKGLAQKIDQTLVGEGEYTRLIERELTAFMGRPGPAAKNPPFLVFAGFPGLGKSELASLAARHSGLPVVRINMQAFSGSDAGTTSGFVFDLYHGIQKAKRLAKEANKDGKFVVLIEELDKVFEVNPKNGELVNRPVMNFIKDLLNEGVFTYSYVLGGSENSVTIDVRDAFNIITMNFAIDRFHFEADPRMTTIEDVKKAADELKARPADLKRLLGSMFLPETVNRLISRFVVMNPLGKADYEKIIEIQAQAAIRQRLFDADGRNKGQIEIRLTPAYRRYLYAESVIPSEGPRHTALTSQQRISTDLEDALKKVPRSSKIAALPVTIELDFKPSTETIIARATPTGNTENIAPQIIHSRQVALTFPPLRIRGKIPRDRLIVAIHEFGHALTGINFGLRFEYATVVQPKAGVGGYVKWVTNSMSAQRLLSTIYMALGSRAMERIFLSADPSTNESVLDITYKSSSDVQQATEMLWNLLYEYGLDPQGGTIERKGVHNSVTYAHFEALPAEKVEALGLVLRDMENYLVEVLLKAQPREWYVEQIKDFARAGGLSEKEFYELIEFPHPGPDLRDYGSGRELEKSFHGSIEGVDEEFKRATEHPQGLLGLTAAENAKAARQEFMTSLKKHFQGEISFADLQRRLALKGLLECESLLRNPKTY